MRDTSSLLVLLLALSGCTADKPASSDTGAAAPGVSSSTSMSADTAARAPLPDTTTDASAGKVSEDGYGNVKAGMTIQEANAALGNSLVIPAKLQECDYVRPRSTPKHLAFMVEKGKISRVDIQPGSDAETASGAKIGDTEERLKSLYPDLVVRPAKYGSGHTLVVTPATGGNTRIVFETDGKKVVKYRAGLLPAVEYVEGCG